MNILGNRQWKKEWLTEEKDYRQENVVNTKSAERG
jgi:hypothetical protein